MAATLLRLSWIEQRFPRANLEGARHDQVPTAGKFIEEIPRMGKKKVQ